VFLVLEGETVVGRARFGAGADAGASRRESEWRLAIGQRRTHVELRASALAEQGPCGIPIATELGGRGEVRGREFELQLSFKGARVRGEVMGERVLRGLPRPWATFEDLIAGAGGLVGEELDMNLVHVWPELDVVRGAWLQRKGALRRSGPWPETSEAVSWEVRGDDRKPVASLEVGPGGEVLRASHRLFDRGLTLVRVLGEDGQLGGGPGAEASDRLDHPALAGAEEAPAPLFGPLGKAYEASYACAERFVTLTRRAGGAEPLHIDTEFHPTALCGLDDDQLVVAGLEPDGSTRIEAWRLDPEADVPLAERTLLYHGSLPGRARVALLSRHLGRAGCVLAYSLEGRIVWSIDMARASEEQQAADAGEGRGEEAWRIYARAGLTGERVPSVAGLAAHHTSWLVGDHEQLGYSVVFVPAEASAATLILTDSNRDGALDEARWVPADAARAERLGDPRVLRLRVR